MSFQEKDEAQPSFAAYLIENQERLGLSNDELAYLSGAIFGAGSDTVRRTAALCLIVIAHCMAHRLQLQSL